MAEECETTAAAPAAADDNRKKSSPPAGYVCKLCGVEGHWIQQCDQKKKNSKKRKASSSEHEYREGVDPSPKDIEKAKKMQQITPPPCDCGDKSRLKKVKRSHVAENSKALHGWIIHRWDDAGSRKRAAISSSNDLRLCGFVFLPNHEKKVHYLLSVPKSLLRLVYKAVLHKRAVRLTKFQELSYDKNDVPFPTASLLEVHQEGLEILSDNDDENTDNITQSDSDVEDVWTLTQWWRKERVDAALQTKPSKAKVNLVATVDAISPIITLDPNNPFALVEIYDKSNTDVTGVIVMNGREALVARSAILPLETLIFRNLVVKPWSIPSMLQKEAPHLMDRIPSRVFVATESDCVSWNHSDLSEFIDSSMPPAITPTNLITKIQGTIEHVQTSNTSSGKNSFTCIQYVGLTLASSADTQQPSQNFCRLYLAHFPMSVSFQMSLRTGAVIQANNVHQVLSGLGGQPLRCKGETLQRFVYGACLRSTLVLVNNGSGNINGQHTGRLSATPLLKIQHPWEDDSFRKIRETYLQMVYRRIVEDWSEQSFRSSTDSLPMEWIVKTLMSKALRNTSEKSEVVDSSKMSSRNPYAEFFDHALSLPNSEKSMTKHSCDCNLSKEDRSGHQRSAVSMIGLDAIRKSSHHCVIEKIRLRQQNTSLNPVCTGWKGTVVMQPKHMFQQGTATNKPEENGCCYIGGYVSELDASSMPGKVVGIHDGSCCFPVSSNHAQGRLLEVNDFAIGRIESVFISSLCIGASARDLMSKDTGRATATAECVASSVSLPSLSNNNKGLLGGCSLVTVNDFLFVTCIQIHCEDFVSPGGLIAQSQVSGPLISIDRCLRRTCDEEFPETGTAQGIMTTCSFRRKVQSDGSNRLCELRVATDPTVEPNHSLDSSYLQSIEVSVCSKHLTAPMLKIAEKLDHVWQGGPISDAQKTAAAAFWSLGGSGKTCALVVGGYEDLMIGSTCNALKVRVCFPISGIERTNLGFLRASCSLKHISAHVHVNEGESTEIQALSSGDRPDFDFEAWPKHEKGRLSKRLPRRQMVKTNSGAERVVGETLAKPVDAIPRASLSQLFNNMFRLLRDGGGTSNLHPSIVQRIPNAFFLGISFCQAQTCCMQCSSSLKDVSKGRRSNTASLNEMDEPSFWHLPHPSDAKCDAKSTRKSDGIKTVYQEDIQKSLLRCPNQCPLHFYGIKWECSGVLDDGTGQATVYADGNTALTLLGMTEETIEKIERGVWHHPDGVLTFKRSIPPSKKLRAAIQDIMRRRLNAAEQSRLLPLPLRAEYFLQMHCRSSTQPRRPLDYYIRCKPLPDKVQHLYHTTLDSFIISGGGNASVFHGEASSYSLPSLKLQLVDFGAP